MLTRTRAAVLRFPILRNTSQMSVYTDRRHRSESRRHSQAMIGKRDVAALAASFLRLHDELVVRVPR